MTNDATEPYVIQVRFPNKYIEDRFNFSKATPPEERFERLNEIWDELKEEELIIDEMYEDWTSDFNVPNGAYPMRSYILKIDMIDKEWNSDVIRGLTRYAQEKNIDLEIRNRKCEDAYPQPHSGGKDEQLWIVRVWIPLESMRIFCWNIDDFSAENKNRELVDFIKEGIEEKYIKDEWVEDYYFNYNEEKNTYRVDFNMEFHNKNIPRLIKALERWSYDKMYGFDIQKLKAEDAYPNPDEE